MERSGRSKVQLAAAERTTVLQVLCIGNMCVGGVRGECVTPERSTLLQALCLGMKGGGLGKLP